MISAVALVQAYGFSNVLLEKFNVNPNSPYSWIDNSEDTFLRESVYSENLQTFESLQRQGDYFEYRMRGWVEIPASGNYRFGISGDHEGILYLGSTSLPGDKKKIASLDGYTEYKHYFKYKSQLSESITLNQGDLIYIEARMSERRWDDHLCVGWNYSRETRAFSSNEIFSIDGDLISSVDERLPEIKSSIPNVELFSVGEEIDLSMMKRDVFSLIKTYAVYQGDHLIQQFQVDEDVIISFETIGMKEIKVVARDEDGADLNSCYLSLDIYYDVVPRNGMLLSLWQSVPGYRVDDLRKQTSYPFSPTKRIHLESFQEYNHLGRDYGAHLVTQIKIPQDGEYTFYLNSDDQSELYVWVNGYREKVCHIDSWVPRNVFDKFSSQKSRKISFSQGELIKIEVVHKEARGGDHVSIAWDYSIEEGGFTNLPVVIPTEQLVVPSPGAPTASIKSPSDFHVVAFGEEIKFDLQGYAKSGEIVELKLYENGSLIYEGLESYVEYIHVPKVKGWNNYHLVVKDSLMRVGTSSKMKVLVQATGSQYSDFGLLHEHYYDVLDTANLDSVYKDSRFKVNPDKRELLLKSCFHEGYAENYATLTRGWLVPPKTGHYEFSIYGDDQVEVFYSYGGPEEKKRLFWLDYSTGMGDWTRRPSQARRILFLEANELIYIEIVHAQRGGRSHFGLGWNYDDDLGEWVDELKVIPAQNFVPFNISEENVEIVGLEKGEILGVSQERTVSVNIQKNKEFVVGLKWLLNNVEIGVGGESISFASSKAGLNELSLRVSLEDGYEHVTKKEFYVNGDGYEKTLDTHGLLMEQWGRVHHHEYDWGFPNQLSRNYSIEKSMILDGAEIAHGELSPTRIRGVLTAPASGYYKFYIAGDDGARFYMSSDENSYNKNLVSSMISSTMFQDFDKRSRQQTGEIYLNAGEKRYIEVLQWNYGGRQHLSLYWNYNQHYNNFSEKEYPIPLELLRPSNPKTTEGKFGKESRDRLISSSNTLDVDIEVGNLDNIQNLKLRVGENVVDLPIRGKQTVTLDNLPGTATIELEVVATLTSGATVTLAKTQWIREELYEDFSSLHGASLEQWNSLKGDKVFHLHRFPSFPFSPDYVNLNMEGFEHFMSRKRYFGERWRGYFIPESTGKYRFWMIARDQAELWVSKGSNPGKAEKMMLTTLSPHVDRIRYADQKSDFIEFEAGQKYYFELYFKKHKRGSTYFSLGWERPDGYMELPIKSEKLRPYVDNPALPKVDLEYPLANSNFLLSQDIPFFPNFMGGSIPDGSSLTLFSGDDVIWTGSASKIEHHFKPSRVGEISLRLELSHPELGTTYSPFITIHVKDEDTDDDGVENDREVRQWGSNPESPHSDHDGLQDGLEIDWFGSSPVVEDVQVEETLSIDVNSPVSIGPWKIGGRGIYNPAMRGSLEYDVELFKADKLVLSVLTSELNVQKQESGELLVYVNDVYVSKKVLKLKREEQSEWQVALPYLTAGHHRIKLTWNNIVEETVLSIEGLKLLNIIGVDDDESGVLDWIESNVSRRSGLVPNDHNYMTPYAVEIETTYPDLIKVYFDGELVESHLASASSVWVSLNIEDAHDLKILHENGAFVEEAQVQKISLDPMLQDELYMTRRNTLSFMNPENSVYTTLQIDNDHYQLTPENNVVEHKFGSIGVKTCVVTTQDASGETAEKQFEITVDYAPRHGSVSTIVNNYRRHHWVSLPKHVDFTSEGIDFQQELDYHQIVNVRLSELGPKRAVLAKHGGENGPIISSLSLEAYDLQVSTMNEGTIRLVEEYSNGTLMAEQVFTVDSFPLDFRIEVVVFVSGVTLDDGSLTRTITAEDFDETGTYRLRYIKTDALRTTLCHRIRVYQGNQLLMTN